MAPNDPAPPAGGRPPLTYGSYLQVPALLSLQRPLSKPPERDEMLFIVIHQVYELWFRLMIHEVGALREAAARGKPRVCLRVYRRLIEIQRVLLQQLSVLETMTPTDFLRFRDHLNPASGFQSLQFRELEFLSGIRDASMLPHLHLTPEERTALEARLAEPGLREAFDTLLRHGGFEIPEDPPRLRTAGPPAAEQAAAAAARLAALQAIYGDPEAHESLYDLCEAMIEYDENFTHWRHHHVQMVERMIGRKPGTGGSEGVGYLATTLSKRCFPELWEVRSRLGAGGYGGAAPPGA